ncbi:hypothetical protein [Lactococcus petauri]|uniref:hypothetical protein n=1 Tax=Lactococcus petauri TaxID=1940789 RepID=UPI0018AB1DEF|nr:hypothetical protein [Lactococcus petauri]MDC0826539.1 hypothetical protein [Lactococcus petauri]
MVLGLLSRQKFTFTISQGKNIDDNTFNDPGNLVNWAEEENIRIESQGEKDQVLIVQKNDKGVILYAQRIEFPLDASVDIDDLLENFYTKKPLEFDKVILEATPEEQIITDNEPPEMPEDMKELLKNSQEKMKEKDSEEYVPDPKIDLDVQEEATEVGNIEEKEFVPASEFHALKDMFLEQQKEVATLKAHTEVKKPISMSQLSKIQAEEFQSENEDVIIADPKSQYILEQKKSEEDIEKSVSEALVNDLPSDFAVNSILMAVKEKVDQTMKSFIDQETAKMNQEIKELDQRDRIAPTIKEFYSKEETAALQKAEEESNKAKAAAIAEEERRHQQELINIANRFESEHESQVEAIKAQYAQKITEKIQEEYDTQTQALSNILQGKTDELKLRQRELNEGLKVNFSQAIDQFNHAHEEVIQNVEKQKNAAPIEISKYLKAI